MFTQYLRKVSRDIKILLVDDDEQRRHDLTVILDFLGEEVIVAGSSDWRKVADASIEDSTEVSAVMLGDCDNQSLEKTVEAMLSWDKGLPFLFVGSQLQVDELSENVRRCVLASLAMPPSYNKMLDSLHRCQVFREQYTHNRSRGERREVQLFRSLVGTSRQIQHVRELIMQVADKDVSVMIQGESGTGKEVVARNLHYHSHRRNKPFVPVNCGAIPAELLESELFGHEKGAFTGATTSKPGLFEVADGGTLFIDELGELAPSLQAKLLRVLEDGHMRRVGATREQRVDVRIIAATNRNLAEDVAARRFREDLFFRINVLSIDLPPLRNRRDDIPLLANHFLIKLGRDWTLSDGAMNALQHYSWPGNVRELHNVIERASILADESHITPTELPHQISHQSPDALASTAIEDTDNLEERERLHVQRVLERENWNRNRTAEALGINRRSLYRLIQKHGLSPHQSSD